MSNETSGYGKMHCFNRLTGTSVGYMGTHDNYVSLVADKAEAADVRWEPDGGDLYLAKETTPNNRYLAVSNNDYAGWDLWANTHLKPVMLNGDGTISLKGHPAIRLYGPYRSMGVDYACWTEEKDKDNSNVLVCKLEV